MPKFFVISDVHGYYNAMIEALNKANFNPETDFLISLGDNLDRGPDNANVMRYLNNLPNKVLVRGNHCDLLEQCCKRGYWEPHDYSNGTFDTIFELGDTGIGNTFDECCDITWKRVKPFFNKMVDYFETKNYIFVHSFIPLINKDGLPMHYIKNRDFSFNPDWRNASKEDWEEARWGNPFDLAEHGFLPDKTLVFGHWGVEHKWAEIEGRKAYNNDARFDPYCGDGYIGIDATTACSGKVNVLVLEDEFI